VSDPRINPRERARERALTHLRKHAEVLATAFDLPLQSIEAESERVRRRYGICYADGRIRIRLHQLRAPDLLKYSVMVDTLCHELAHLRHFDHGRRFWRLYRRILEYARRHGIYRPGPEATAPQPTPFQALPAAITRAAPLPRAARPAPQVQLDLF
jgi:predicted metal-dependent hydrolase